jgi:hypothetical protein
MYGMVVRSSIRVLVSKPHQIFDLANGAPLLALQCLHLLLGHAQIRMI